MTATTLSDTTGAVRFDIERDRRIGLPEAVFCEGKPFSVLLALLERFADDNEKPILFTRLSPETMAKVPRELAERFASGRLLNFHL